MSLNNSVPQSTSANNHTNAIPDAARFPGFDLPEQNWFKMPNEWTNITAEIKSLAELKIVEYVLRHTWGYQEYGIAKKITIDEFMHGRKRADKLRMDKGTGLSKQSVINGIKSAVNRGLLKEEIDDSDKARIKKYYLLRMKSKSDNSDVKDLDIGSKHLDIEGQQFRHRTEKDTLEIKQQERNVVVALTEQGITPKTAEKLARGYNRKRIENNIALLQHLQETNPKKVSKNPAGWLRRAIEEDYAETSGAGAESKPIPGLAQDDIQAKIEMVTAASEPESPDIWQEILGGLQHSLQGHFQHLVDSSLVEFANGLLVIQVVSEGSRQWLENRLMHRILPQARRYAGADVEIKFVSDR